MATDVVIRPAVPEADGPALAALMRPADVAEVWAAAKMKPLEAVRHSLAMSTEAWAGLADGELVCLWGVAPRSFLAGEGSPWLLGTPALERNARAFLSRCPQHLNAMFSVYNRLVNWVDARNTAAIRWLRWLGFTLHPAEPYGPFRLPFHRFEKERGQPCVSSRSRP